MLLGTASKRVPKFLKYVAKESVQYPTDTIATAPVAADPASANPDATPDLLPLAAFFARLDNQRYTLANHWKKRMNKPTKIQAHNMVGITSEIIDSRFMTPTPQYPMQIVCPRLQ